MYTSSQLLQQILESTMRGPVVACCSSLLLSPPSPEGAAVFLVPSSADAPERNLALCSHARAAKTKAHRVLAAAGSAREAQCQPTLQSYVQARTQVVSHHCVAKSCATPYHSTAADTISLDLQQTSSAYRP